MNERWGICREYPIEMVGTIINRSNSVFYIRSAPHPPVLLFNTFRYGGHFKISFSLLFTFEKGEGFLLFAYGCTQFVFEGLLQLLHQGIDFFIL